MKDNLFDEKQLSGIKEYTRPDEELINKTKKMMEVATQNKKEKVSSIYYGRMMRMSAACFIGLLCGILAYQFVFKGAGQESNMPQNNEQTHVAENNDENNTADGKYNQSEVPKFDADAQHIVMAGGPNEEINILEEINVVGMGDTMFKHNNLEELTEFSEEIIKGTIIDWESSCTPEAYISTKYHILVEKTYKGSIAEGELVTIIASGGVVKAKDYKEVFEEDLRIDWDSYSEQELENGYIQYMHEDEPPVNEGDYCIFMLSKVDATENYGNSGETLYSVVGDYRGRFIINGDKIKRYLPEYQEEMIKIEDVTEFEKKLSKYLGDVKNEKD